MILELDSDHRIIMPLPDDPEVPRLFLVQNNGAGPLRVEGLLLESGARARVRTIRTRRGHLRWVAGLAPSVSPSRDHGRKPTARERRAAALLRFQRERR